jgi:hypothetical protein
VAESDFRQPGWPWQEKDEEVANGGKLSDREEPAKGDDQGDLKA